MHEAITYMPQTMSLNPYQILTSTILLLSSFLHTAHSATPGSLRLPDHNTTHTIFQSQPFPSSSLHLDWAWIEGITVRNRTRQLPGQAIGGILIQSIYSMTYGVPSENITDFSWTLNYPRLTRDGAFPFNATIHVKSYNLPPPLNLDRSRLTTALSLLGDHFDGSWDLEGMWEWEFDVGVVESKVYPSSKRLNVIASGRIAQVVEVDGE